MTLSKQTFAKGPSINVLVLPKENSFKIELAKSSQFSISFFTDLPSKTREELLEWLYLYSEKKRPPLFILPQATRSPFTIKVLHALQTISFGTTCTYQELAHLCESPRASRAVGNVCRLNSFPLFIPCHRVLHKTGGVGDFAFGSSLKELLLNFEQS